MNNCQFAGVVIQDASLSTLNSGLKKCDFKVRVSKGASDKEFDVPLQAWAALAEKFTPQLRIGTKVLVNAAYEPTTFESKYKPGQMTTKHNFTAKDILLLSKNNSQSSNDNEEKLDLPF